MNRLKNLTLLSLIAISAFAFAGCSKDNKNDEPEEPYTDLYDWDIMKMIISRETHEVETRINETWYQKSEAYVLDKKIQWEKKSNQGYTWRFSYQKRK